MENNNYLITGPLTAEAPEAVQEYRISTNNYSAEYGRTSGFVANAVSRGGLEPVPRNRLSVSEERRAQCQWLPGESRRRSPAWRIRRTNSAFRRAARSCATGCSSPPRSITSAAAARRIRWISRFPPPTFRYIRRSSSLASKLLCRVSCAVGQQWPFAHGKPDAVAAGCGGSYSRRDTFGLRAQCEGPLHGTAVLRAARRAGLHLESLSRLHFAARGGYDELCDHLAADDHAHADQRSQAGLQHRQSELEPAASRDSVAAVGRWDGAAGQSGVLFLQESQQYLGSAGQHDSGARPACDDGRRRSAVSQHQRLSDGGPRRPVPVQQYRLLRAGPSGVLLGRGGAAGWPYPNSPPTTATTATTSSSSSPRTASSSPRASP